MTQHTEGPRSGTGIHFTTDRRISKRQQIDALGKSNTFAIGAIPEVSGWSVFHVSKTDSGLAT
jgi:hypothetical protein